MDRKKSEKNIEFDLDGVQGDESSDDNKILASGNETDNT